MQIDDLIIRRLVEAVNNGTMKQCETNTAAVVNRVRNVIRSLPGGFSNFKNVIAGAAVAKNAIETNQNPLLITEQDVFDVVDQFSASNANYRQLIAI